MSAYTDYDARGYLLDRYKTQLRARALDPVPDDFDLLEEGIIDSLGIMELVTDLERRFGHPIDFEELDAEKMTVLGPLADHIQRKLAEADGSRSSSAVRLAELPKAVVTIKGKSIEAWLALDERSIRKGLMDVTPDELTPMPTGIERGMLFVYESERPLSFWMFKTVVPLDIVYLDSHGRIINWHSAQPLETRLLYDSSRPAQYVLEVRSGLMREWKIEPGDRVELPDLVTAR